MRKLQDYRPDPRHDPRHSNETDEKEFESVYGGETSFSVEDLNLKPDQYREVLTLFKSRLENVFKRQQDRLSELRKGNPLLVPVFFHASPITTLTGIASTGVEVCSGLKGKGAYVATEPELSYGPVIWGYGEENAFITTNGYCSSMRGHTVQGGRNAFWTAFEEVLEVQPGFLNVRNKFLNALQLVLRERIQKYASSMAPDLQITFELEILHQCKENLLFRVEEGKRPRALQLKCREMDKIHLINVQRQLGLQVNDN